MEAKRPKWLAVGKEPSNLTHSLSFFARGRPHSQSHQTLSRSQTQLTEKSLERLTRNKSAMQLINQDAVVQKQQMLNSEGQNSKRITINILSSENKTASIQNSPARIIKSIEAKQPISQKPQKHFPNNQKELKTQQALQKQQLSADQIKSITCDPVAKQFISLLKLECNLQQHLPLNCKQQLTQSMSHNHVPFYLRTQDFTAQYHPEEPSDPSHDDIPFGDQFNQSVVLEAQDLSADLHKYQPSRNGGDSAVNEDESEIIESMSFAEESKYKDASNLPPIVHFREGYDQKGQRLTGERMHSERKDYERDSRKKFIAKTKLKLNQLSEMAQNMKIIHETIVKQVHACQSRGKSPLIMKNEQIYSKMMEGFGEIMVRHGRVCAQREVQRQSELFSRMLNSVYEKGLLGECQFREMDNSRKVQRIIGSLEERAREMKELREGLVAAGSDCEKTSGVLLNKLAEINELKEELERVSNQQSALSVTAQKTGNLSSEFQKLLRDKEARSNQMAKQIEELKERNQQLLDDKERLQEEVFTLEQKIIGVEMEVQERVRHGIQQIKPAIQQQLREQIRTEDTAKQTSNNNQFFLQTIDTLSQQIKDLTEKCKYYENFIRDQERTNQTPKPSLHQQQQHSKDFEQIITKRLAQLQFRENTLQTIENELTFKDKKLKELENRLTRQATHFDKRERQCTAKEEEIQKYLQELNAREEELYMWEKQLNEEQKKLARKINELQREKSLFENQKNTHLPVMPTHMATIIDSRNVPPSYSNQQYPLQYSHSNMVKKPMPSYQDAESSTQAHTRMFYDRPYSYHQARQPTYEEEPSMNHQNGKSYERNYHNMSQQHIRYNRLNDSQDIKSPQHQMDQSQMDISELQDNRPNQKQKTQSMRVRGADFNPSNAQQSFSKVSQHRIDNEKLYLSSTYDKKSQMVEEILARRRNEGSMINRNERGESKSPISVNRSYHNDMYKKSDMGRVRSPAKNDMSFHGMKEVTERKLKERYERRRMFEKPSKDMGDFNRPGNAMVSPTSGGNGKKYGYEYNMEGGPERQYTSRQFMKNSIPGVHKINEKLEKLKEEIKREVRDLE